MKFFCLLFAEMSKTSILRGVTNSKTIDKKKHRILFPLKFKKLMNLKFSPESEIKFAPQKRIDYIIQTKLFIF